MKNKTIAQIWFSIIAIAFLWGLAGQPTVGVGFLCIQTASVVFSIWGMVRLWNSIPATNK